MKEKRELKKFNRNEREIFFTDGKKSLESM